MCTREWHAPSPLCVRGTKPYIERCICSSRKRRVTVSLCLCLCLYASALGPANQARAGLPHLARRLWGSWVSLHAARCGWPAAGCRRPVDDPLRHFRGAFAHPSHLSLSLSLSLSHTHTHTHSLSLSLSLSVSLFPRTRAHARAHTHPPSLLLQCRQLPSRTVSERFFPAAHDARVTQYSVHSRLPRPFRLRLSHRENATSGSQQTSAAASTGAAAVTDACMLVLRLNRLSAWVTGGRGEAVVVAGTRQEAGGRRAVGRGWRGLWGGEGRPRGG